MTEITFEVSEKNLGIIVDKILPTCADSISVETIQEDGKNIYKHNGEEISKKDVIVMVMQHYLNKALPEYNGGARLRLVEGERIARVLIF